MEITQFLLQDQVKWKRAKDRNPLILNGGRQCVKTWLLKKEEMFLFLGSNQARFPSYQADFPV